MDKALNKMAPVVWGLVALIFAILITNAGVFAYRHYQGIAASNERLVELREEGTPAFFEEPTVIREVWKNKYSVLGFCQSTVASVSEDAAEEFRANLVLDGADSSEAQFWRPSPTDGYFADCFEPDDWSMIQSILSSEGAFVRPNGGGADYREFMRWITHYWLFDPESRLLYQATKTSDVPG
ncbi:MAG: hypothetical protein AAGB25_01940 [Pseudomonadota bacterium]